MIHSKKLLLIPAVLFYFTGILSSSSQSVSKPDRTQGKIEWSGPENGSAKFWYAKLLGQSEEGTFLLKSNMPLDNNQESSGFRTRKYAIDFFDKTFDYRWEKQVTPVEKGAKLEKILFLDDKALCIFTSYDSKKEILSVIPHWIDSKGISESTVKPLIEFPGLKRSSIQGFGFANSADFSLFGLIAVLPGTETNTGSGEQTTRVYVNVSDESLNTFFKKEIALPVSREELSPDKFFISGDSVLYFYNQTNGNSNSGLVICSFDLKTEKAEVNRVSLNPKMISGFYSALDDVNKKFVFSGFYSDQNNYSAAGVFYLSLNTTTLAILTQKTEEFGESFLMNFVGEPKTNDKKELLNYRVNKLVLKNNGGAILLSEARFTTDYTYYDFFTKTYITRTIFHTDNIIAVSLNEKGETEWKKVIRKKQESQEDGGYYLSCFPAICSDKIYFLYNSSDGKFNRIIAHSIDSKGTDFASPLTEYSEDATGIPMAGKQVDMNVVVMPAFRKNRFFLAKISL